MIVYFVRHGESEANKHGFHHKPETPLTKTGIRQAKILAKRLKKHRIDVIYTSPLARAKKTAEIIAAELKLPIEFSESLREIRTPSQVWGKSLKNEKAAEIDDLSLKLFLKGKTRYSDEETFAELSKRGDKILAHLLRHHKNQAVLCVSHSTMIKMAAAKMIFGETLTAPMFAKIRSRLWIKNTGITLCEYSRKFGWLLVVWNDTTHL